MSSLRFIHAADLHLDSPFTGIKSTNENISRHLCDATFNAYKNIIDLCLVEKVDALLLAGDLYDGADRSLRAQLALVDGLNRLDEAGIRSFVCFRKPRSAQWLGSQARFATPLPPLRPRRRGHPPRPGRP